MNLRRKSTTNKKVCKKNTSRDSDDSSDSNKEEIDVKENFVKLCVENFEYINDKSTIRGTPTSAKNISRHLNVKDTWEKITKSMNNATKTNKPVEFYKKKFQNIKRDARKRQILVEKQKKTGGGTLTKNEQQIVNSPAFTDLALKLGVSAFGNEPRADSDNQPGTSGQPPTGRLRNILSTSSLESEASLQTEMGRLNFEGAFSKPSTSGNSTSNRRFTIDEECTSTSNKRFRKDDSTTSSLEYRDLFTENLFKQSENHQLQAEILQLHKEKVKLDIEKSKLELETARTLAAIEINKQKQLAELEIEKKRKDLNK